MAEPRQDLTFASGSGTCHAWLYRPVGPPNATIPCILMAHGIGGTRDAGLEPFADRFAAAGFAVLLFDYLHFGASTGEPRQLFSVKQQLADWQHAIACARGLPGIDPQKIALWGTSFSGGHVIVTAAHDPRIAAVSALAPMMDGRAGLWLYLRSAGLLRLLEFTAMATCDRLRAWFPMPPLLIALVDRDEGLAVMHGRDAAAGCLSIAPPHWRNEICPRYALTIGIYRPLKLAAKITCPVLIQICEQDQLVSNKAVIATAKILGHNAEMIQFPCGHFGIYHGPHFENAIANQIEFFSRITVGVGAFPPLDSEVASRPPDER